MVRILQGGVNLANLENEIYRADLDRSFGKLVLKKMAPEVAKLSKIGVR